MRLGTKVLMGAVGSMGLVIALGLVVQRQVIVRQSVTLTHANMRDIVLEGESVRSSLAELNERQAFDRERLIEEAHTLQDYRQSTLYKTVPIIAAINSISKVAEQHGYKFRVVRKKPRNRDNLPTPEETAVLDYLQDPSRNEFFEVNQSAGRIVYARPIVLTNDCLSCHGDPARSPTGDGKDALGFPMEGWQAGQREGAFILSSDLSEFDKVVNAASGETLLWSSLGGTVCCFAFWLFNRRTIIRPVRDISGVISRTSSENAASANELSGTAMTLAEGASAPRAVSPHWANRPAINPRKAVTFARADSGSAVGSPVYRCPRLASRHR